MKRTKEEKVFYYTRPGLYLKKIEKLNDCEEKVVLLLAKSEHLRNCDKCLIFAYWKEADRFHMFTKWFLDESVLIEKIHTLTPAETITRVRRYIQNDLNLWLPTEKDVIESREINKDAVKEWAKHEG